MNKFRLSLALTVVCVLSAALLSGCGGVPGDSFAVVDGKALKKSELNHWISFLVKSSSPNAVVPDPPNFTACIANQRKQLPKLKKGQTAPTDAQLKQQCQQLYTSVKTQAETQLIQTQWLLLQAKKMKINVPEKKVQETYQEKIKAAFPKPGAYQQFLKRTGGTPADIQLYYIKVPLISQEIQASVLKTAGKVTDKEIADYYNQNKARFAQPARRDLLIIKTKTQAQAQQALSAVKSGTSWAAAAKKFSIDAATKNTGGKLPGVTQGSQPKPLDAAVFSAKQGATVGPVKTTEGFYIFQVTKISPPSSQTLQQATPIIRQMLESKKQQTAFTSFVSNFEKTWKAETECAKDFTVPLCKNAPPTKTTPAKPPTPPASKPK